MRDSGTAIGFSAIVSGALGLILGIGMLINRYYFHALHASPISLSYKIDSLTTGDNLNIFWALSTFIISLASTSLVFIISKGKRKQKTQNALFGFLVSIVISALTIAFSMVILSFIIDCASSSCQM